MPIKQLNLVVVIVCYMAILTSTGLNAQVKDTLFFKFDENYIMPALGLGNENHFIIKDSNNEETFFFKKDAEYKALKYKKKISIKKYIRKSEYYNRASNRKLNNLRLMQHLEKYIVFLIKDEVFIKVTPGVAIE